MEEPYEYEVVGGRQRVIKRPRLTRLLDDSKARILVLLAPAGYGKTTLARQWLAGKQRPSGWYTGGPAAADVAALCLELASASQVVVPGAGRRLRKRLTATTAPEREVQVLAELLAEDLVAWPADAWLAFDDYQFAERPAAEEFVALLLQLAPIRMILTTRRRPAWATARRVLYGEIFEVKASDLSMTDAEAKAVLSPIVKPDTVKRLLERANGWPAVIALAALSNHETLPTTDLPPTLFEYFADELYQALAPELQDALLKLAAAATVDGDLCTFLFGERAESVADDSIQAGFLTRFADRTLLLHPLLRAFLRTKLKETNDAELQRTAHAIGSFYVDAGRWDDAFEVAEELHDPQSLHTLLERALESLLSAGRLATLEQWVSYAEQQSIEGPLVQLARAHIDQRQGLSDRAEILALQAAEGLTATPRLVTNALLVAAQGAHFADRPTAALTHLRRARELTTDQDQLREVLWSAFCSAMEIDPSTAEQFYREFALLHENSAVHVIRVAGGRLFIASRAGGLCDVVDRSLSLLDFSVTVQNPEVRTGFLNCLASGLIQVARYEEASMVSGCEISEAQSSKLGFVLPYAHLYRGMAAHGLRNFREAHGMFERGRAIALEISNVHAQINLALALARLLLAEGAPNDALEATEPRWLRSATAGVTAELEATRALALACLGNHEEALGLAGSADRRSTAIETAALTGWVRGIVALRKHEADAASRIQDAARFMQMSGNAHCFVDAYRAYPPLLRAAASHFTQVQLTNLLNRANDLALGRTVGLDIPRLRRSTATRLTRRELEVYELLSEGRSNREIGRALFISQTTVKVHVRHIFEKLGVRTRTEAALKAAEIL